MANQITAKTRVAHLAETIHRDIVNRSLKAGDSYLTAAEAGQMLGVSPMMANRALNVLAERRILVRRPHCGTFIGTGIDMHLVTGHSRVHLFCVSAELWDRRLAVGQMSRGLRAHIPNARLQIHHVEAADPPAVIRDELIQAGKEPFFGGIILALATREIQQMVAELGIPAVVHGSVFPGTQLPSLEPDQKEVGRLMVELALEGPVRRLVFLCRELWRHGDTLAFEGITEAVHAAEFPARNLRLRNLPDGDSETAGRVMHEVVGELFRESDEPLAFLCRNQAIAELVCGLLDTEDAAYRDSCRVVYNHASDWEAEPLPRPRVTVACSVEEQYAMMGRLLADIIEGRADSTTSIRLPSIAVR